MICSLGISNFLKRFLVFPILLFSSISLLWSLKKAYFSLLFFGTLHSNKIFPFLLCFWLLFFSQLFVRPPQTAILLFCISFPWRMLDAGTHRKNRYPCPNTKKQPQWEGRRGTIIINWNSIPTGWYGNKLRTIIPKKFSHRCEGSEPHVGIPSLRIQQRVGNPQGIWPCRCQLQIGTYQEHCQQLNNKGICHLPLWRLNPMLL